ncbi:MAG: VCBS repeat-containing protein [Flavisolibacter sp.]
MRNKFFLLFTCTLVSLVQTVWSQSGNALFTLLDARNTGVKFTNTIRENDSLHVFSYEYLYNGHGVGVADFNNDGLVDIFFSGNAVANKLYLNKGNFKFDDITKSAGVKGNGTWSTGVSIADVNGDGLPDIYVCHSGKFPEAQLANELFINKGSVNGVPEFEEQAKMYGLDAPGTQSTQAAFFDYDLDGDLDMFLLNHSNHTYNPFLNTRNQRATPDFHFGNRLFRNDRSADGTMHFTDVTLQAGIINNALNFGLGIVVSDINNDGWPDIYTTSDYTEQDCYYVNNRNGTFTQSLQNSFTHISKYSMGADIADYNNDGRPDVLTLDMLPEDNHRQKLLKGPDEYDQYHLLLDSGYYHQQMRNMLHLNEGMDAQGNIRFSEIGQLAGVSNTDWSWAGLFADLDNDGWKDLVVTNGYLRDFTDMDFLKYTVSEAQLTEAAKGNMNFKSYDLVKKMPSNKLTNYLFRNNGDLSFSNVSKAWGFTIPTVSNCAAYADLDNDGDLDLIIGNNNEPAMLYRNNAESVFRKHYLKIKLEGSHYNSEAFGARVKLYSGNKIQYAEQYPVRGFQSTVSPVLFFGLGIATTADSIVIEWPKGTKTTLSSIKADQLITVKQSEAKDFAQKEVSEKGLFETIEDKRGLDFVHKENDFIDFKNEVLLPYQLSRMGPALAKADVNKDGLEDIFIGGAIGQSGKLYLQTAGGSFTESASHPWQADVASEDVNAVFIDVDNDGDEDLYVVSGGNEYQEGSPEYADRLYLNDGLGNFTIDKDALPSMLNNKQAIAAADFDKDGDIDIFIGGGCVPGSFPFSTRSYLLRNDTKNGVVHFTDVTESMCEELLDPGMVTAATWVDLNKDDFPELMIAGDWMPIRLFQNTAGTLKDASTSAGLTNTDGMWSAIAADDIDNDGDVDFVVGNCGLNDQFKPSKKEPMTIYANDFDDNGVIDPIVCYYVQGKSYPMASRDELLDQIVPLRKKFIKYKDYADATIEDIFSKDKIETSKKYFCYQLASCLLVNDGQGHFDVRPLPVGAQVSKVFGIATDDFDNDGKKDILLTGNFFPYRTQLGRCDASLGVFLKGKGNADFDVLPNSQTHLYAAGDIRKMITIKNAAKQQMIILAKNNDAVEVIKTKR